MNTLLTTPASPARRGGYHRRRWLIVAVLVLGGVLAGGYGLANLHGGQSASAAASNDEAMTARASQVMGFDLNATTHTFTKTTDGGAEQVVANDPADQANIGSLRSHLQTVAGQFAEGNYSQPAAIHSADMPGLAELQAGAARVRVGYEQIPAGARITYRTGDPALITALHSWFDAQNTDHAMPGMGMGH